MGITLHQDGDREYYRVTKAWNGKEIQRYVRIRKSKEKAFKEALAMEESLSQRQNAARERRRLAGLGVLHEDGRVIGLQLLYRTREGRKPWLEFKMRVKEPGKEVRFKTVSVPAHGIEKAFDIAVERICELRGVPLGSDLHDKMQGAKGIYLEDAKDLMRKADPEVRLTLVPSQASPLPDLFHEETKPSDTKSKDQQSNDLDDLESGFQDAVGEFSKKRDGKRVIRG